jgi:[histone H3]-lysine36 N-dimethyltransferase SETMAR
LSATVLQLRRVSSRWIPHSLQTNEKKERERISQTLLGQFHSDPVTFLDQLVTGDECWFYCYDPYTKQQSSEWRVKGENPPLKVKRSRSVRKFMATVFWDMQGILLLKWLPEGSTINSTYYCDILSELKEQIKCKRRGKWSRGVCLLHDNARPHTSHQTSEHLSKLGFRLLPHPPIHLTFHLVTITYSPISKIIFVESNLTPFQQLGHPYTSGPKQCLRNGTLRD